MGWGVKEMPGQRVSFDEEHLTSMEACLENLLPGSKRWISLLRT